MHVAPRKLQDHCWPSVEGTQAAASYSAHSLKEAVEVLPPGEGEGVVGAEPRVATKQRHPQDSKDKPKEQQEQHHVLDGSETLQDSSSTMLMGLDTIQTGHSETAKQQQAGGQRCGYIAVCIRTAPNCNQLTGASMLCI